jgi:hypothetical protein
MQEEINLNGILMKNQHYFIDNTPIIILVLDGILVRILSVLFM